MSYVWKSANTWDSSMAAKGFPREKKEKSFCYGAKMNSPAHFWDFLENLQPYIDVHASYSVLDI